MYDGVDFDVDGNEKSIPPVLVSPPFTPISLVGGLAFVLSTEEQDQRAVDMNLSLSEPLWSILGRDPSLRRFRQL
jgi:hypothetical protein